MESTPFVVVITAASTGLPSVFNSQHYNTLQHRMTSYDDYRTMKCTHFWQCPGIHVPWLKTPNKNHNYNAGLLYLTRSLPNTKRKCYYPPERQLRWESITGQFQTHHTVSVKNSHNTVSPSPGSTAPSGPGLPHCQGFRITFRHTTVGRTPLDEWSARGRDLYVATYNAHRRWTYTRPAGFGPAISASERPQTHARPLGSAFPDICFNTIPKSSVFPVVSFQVICPPRHRTHLTSDQTYTSSPPWHVRSNSFKRVV